MKLPSSFSRHIFLKLPVFIVVTTIHAQNYSLQTLTGGTLVTEGSSASSAVLRYPAAAASDSSGNLFIADREDNRIWEVDPTGRITTYAGNGTQGYTGDNGSASHASLNHPTGVARDATGAVYICDSDNHLVRRVGPDGTITTAAGNGIAGHTGDNGPARKAQITPQAIAIDPVRSLLIADGRRVRQVSATTGNLTTIAGNFYVANRANHRVRRVSPDGIITTIAGTGTVGFAGDNGPAAQANLNSPTDVAIDSIGNIYIADNGNARIRLATTDGVIQTIAGIGVSYPFNGDGPALLVTSAPFGSL